MPHVGVCCLVKSIFYTTTLNTLPFGYYIVNSSIFDHLSLSMASVNKILEKKLTQGYPYGFASDIEQHITPPGLSEATIKFISQCKKEPSWLLEWRLQAFRHWQSMKEPTWSTLRYHPIDYQTISYYAEPKAQKPVKSLEDVDPAILATFERLGIPLTEQKKLAGVAVDAVLDSVSVGTTFQKELSKHGILFCSFSEAVQRYPNLVRQYLGKVVPPHDNYFAALNAAVFSDGSFCYIPEGVRCPMELSTYFRINAMNTGQFERTLIIAEPKAYCRYLEGCTAPMRNTHQLHAAVVEIYAKEAAEVRYATVQNWSPGNEKGEGGVYNFVTKRGLCAGNRSKISWTQLEAGSSHTWKYPSCILRGDDSIGEFYSVAITKGYQQADTGTKMIHIGKRTKSRIVSKGISADQGKNTYRALTKVLRRATNAYNYSQCDSLLLGDQCNAYTLPYLEANNTSSTVRHEATTSKMDEEALFYAKQRGIQEEKAQSLMILGFCREVLSHLPMEFAIEAQKLLEITLEGSIG